ncbi:hypothetical protein FGL86_05720 [Pistricoccus aurantiacus]|uniref:Uncharacterized protein n=1 Tax=Pistricoccus aurantiacus TaxID=1883414 RepID=A0A5B8SSZ8_9GAMM|nr:hypothetical protein [Pistricoccus aurantiacus]QEA38625.1 hypothetical protein FGL86_05720 [Pistricoccus aurantiacus]
MSDMPIEPQDFCGGVKVVDFGDLRVARGLTRRPVASCRHLHLVYDNNERRVWCEDCESEVEPFDAFKAVCENIDSATNRLKRREQEVKEAEQFATRSRAVKALDKAWRSHHQAPMCPHCREALLPEDFSSGAMTTGRELARAARRR